MQSYSGPRKYEHRGKDIIHRGELQIYKTISRQYDYM